MWHVQYTRTKIKKPIQNNRNKRPRNHVAKQATRTPGERVMCVINRSFVLDRTWWLCSFRSFCYICYGFSTVHAYTRTRLGPDPESLQNEADRSIFTSKFVFVLFTKSTQQKSKSK